MKCKVFLSKNTDDWKTPSFIYDKFKDMGYFDPCPFESRFDGLKIEWKDKNFVNPPYSKLKAWIEKSILEHQKGHDVVLLIPARTDTKAFKMTNNQIKRAFNLAGARVAAGITVGRNTATRTFQIWGILEIVKEEPFFAIIHSDLGRDYQLTESTRIEFITRCIVPKEQVDYSHRKI